MDIDSFSALSFPIWFIDFRQDLILLMRILKFSQIGKPKNRYFYKLYYVNRDSNLVVTNKNYILFPDIIVHCM